MGKKGDNIPTSEGDSAAKVYLLRRKMLLMEEAMKKQSLDFKSEMSSSQAKIHADIKGQLDDFLSTMMKLQSPSPPPQAKSPESVASNMAQATDL
jgi:hypothetical protein